MVWIFNEITSGKRSSGYAWFDEKKKSKNKKVGLPIHNGKRMCLTSQSVNLQKSKSAHGFDFWLHFSGIGNKTIFDIPLKSHKQFKKLNRRGTLLKSFVISESGVQLCFEIETGTKKTEGNDVGIDVEVNSLFSLSNGKQYGDIKPILEKVDRKVYGSKNNKRQGCISSNTSMKPLSKCSNQKQIFEPWLWRNSKI